MIPRMYWTCAEVLSVGAQLSEAPELPSPDVLKRRIGALLDDMSRRCLELGVPKRDLDDARYALVAFIDEQLFRASWAGRQEWMLEPLQLVYFNENTAGEGFFVRLDALEREPARLQVLEIFYLCLALGFQGKFAVRGGEGLGVTIDRLAGTLARGTPYREILSPRGLPTEPRRGAARREAPVLFVGGALVALALVLALSLKLVLLSATSDTTARIQAAASAPAPGGRKR